MSNFARISKSDLLCFARLIYKQAVNGYCDLEDSVCITESNRFFESLEKSLSGLSHNGIRPTITSTADMTLVPASFQGSQYFVGFDPSFSQTVVYSDLSDSINPTEQQLLLFNETDSSNNTINEVVVSNEEIQVDSNEGHVFHNF